MSYATVVRIYFQLWVPIRTVVCQYWQDKREYVYMTMDGCNTFKD